MFFFWFRHDLFFYRSVEDVDGNVASRRAPAQAQGRGSPLCTTARSLAPISLGFAESVTQKFKIPKLNAPVAALLSFVEFNWIFRKLDTLKEQKNKRGTDKIDSMK